MNGIRGARTRRRMDMRLDDPSMCKLRVILRRRRRRQVELVSPGLVSRKFLLFLVEMMILRVRLVSEFDSFESSCCYCVFLEPWFGKQAVHFRIVVVQVQQPTRPH